MLKPVLVEMFLLKCGVRDLQHLRGRDWHKAKSYLEGVRIESAHQPLPRPRKISGLSDRAIREHKWRLPNHLVSQSVQNVQFIGLVTKIFETNFSMLAQIY